MTAADKYYLKAKDCYPYEIEEALEALEYGRLTMRPTQGYWR